MAEVPNVSTSLRAYPAEGHRSFLGLVSLNHLTLGWPLLLLALAICWFLFFQELSGEWRINAQYSYGYAVPLLGLALFWRRWPERPAAEAGALSGTSFAGALFLGLLPAIRLVLQANPEWRLLYWLHGLQVVGLSFCFLYRIGGVTWVRFFAAPILFTLVAVPWPMGFEQWAIQGLMRLVAGWTVEVAGWFAIPAVQHGNLIETATGIVGIDEACSGVRSLQSALMLSIFLGEMYRFTAARRLALLGASMVFDLAANLARTSFLVWAATNRGLAQMEAWHDTAGLLVMFIVLPSLLGLAWLMKPRRAKLARGSADRSPIVSSHPETRRRDAPAPMFLANLRCLPSVPRWAGIIALLWLAVGEVASEAWYRMHEGHLIATTRWSVAWPVQNPHFKKTTVPDKALAVLRCSNSEAAAWDDDAGNHWSGFLLRWAPGKNSAQLAKGHRPDICFPAAGARLVEDFGKVSVPVGTFEIPFRQETFDMGGKLVHVFYCLWPDRVAPHEKTLLEDGSQKSRLLAVLAGKRHLGQQVLELVMAGTESQPDAVELIKRTLPELIQVEQAR